MLIPVRLLFVAVKTTITTDAYQSAPYGDVMRDVCYMTEFNTAVHQDGKGHTTTNRAVRKGPVQNTSNMVVLTYGEIGDR